MSEWLSLLALAELMSPEGMLFIALQVANVILSAIKSIVMIKVIKENKWGSILANTIYFGIYTVVLKLLIGLTNLPLLIIVTMSAHFFGSWAGLVITDKLRKADL